MGDLCVLRSSVFQRFLRLLRCRIRLEYAERIPFSVDEISLPAHARYSELWHGNLSASAQDLCCSGIVIRHLHRAHKGVGSVLGRRRLYMTLQQTASRPFSLNPPVLNRQSFRLSELPAKYLTVKSHGSVRIVGLDFKIGWRVHRLYYREKDVAQVCSVGAHRSCVRLAVRFAPSPLLHRRRFRRDLWKHNSRARQRFRYVGADIFCANMLFKF